MQTYIAKRLLLIIPTLLGAAALVFVIMRVIPGDVALLIFGGDQAGHIDPKQLAAMRHRLGLDQPLIVQFGTWLWGVLRFDFGNSLWTGRPVVEELLVRLPLSLELALAATVVSVVIAIPFGMLAAVRQDTWVDYVIRVISIGGLAIPSFWVGILCILFLVIWFGWGPPLEFTPPWVDPWANFQQMVWPIVTVGYRYAAVTTRMTRSTLLEVLREDYIRTAWAKGQRERAIVFRHGLKNAMLPVITLIGTEFAFLIGGLVVTETVFTLSGAGGAILLAMMAVAGFAEPLAPYDAYRGDYGLQFARPSADHWFGTDEFGRDILSRIMYGARIALFVGFTASFAGCTLGGLLGVISAYYGGKNDLLLPRLMDIPLSFPQLILALALPSLLRPPVPNAGVANSHPHIPR